MASFSNLIGLLHLLLLLSPAGAQLYQNCDYSSNFTANSTYQANRARLLSTLASDGYATGFLKTSAGQPPNQVYGLVNCRGDVNATECRDCLATGTQEVTRVCAGNKGADIWYDPCLVRFSDQPLQTTAANWQRVVLNNENNVAEPERFNRLLSLLLNRTAAVAANRTQRCCSTAYINRLLSLLLLE